MLAMLDKASLTAADFNTMTEFLLPGLLAKNMITMVYADGGNGKSWFGFALAKYCAELPSIRVTYLDFDNPLTVLSERGVDTKLVACYNNLRYIQRSKCEMSPCQLLELLAEHAIGKAFANEVFIVDSLRDFTDVNNDSKAMHTMGLLKDIREAGGTIILLHHSNKDGRNYQGSNNIRNSLDNMFQLKKLELSQGIGVMLCVTKERCAIEDKAFDINPSTFELNERDVNEARLSQDDVLFIEDVKRILMEQPDLHKSGLLEAAGFAKDDKTARNKLDKYDGIYWNSRKNHTRILYALP